LDIGVLGYIGIVWPKEHSPEVWSVPPVTPCIYPAHHVTDILHPPAYEDGTDEFRNVSC